MPLEKQTSTKKAPPTRQATIYEEVEWVAAAHTRARNQKDLRSPVESAARAGHLLVIAGVFITISIFRTAEKSEQRLLPAPYLSRASNCVWQMDREA